MQGRGVSARSRNVDEAPKKHISKLYKAERSILAHDHVHMRA